jgi:DtxR family transcriptional regulator, manganese transport regulator
LALKTIEEYVEAIYTLEMRSGRAHTTDIALILNIKPPSVTEMLQKLHDMDLVIYEPYRGAKLTPPGMKMAQELMQSHKTLVEFFEIIGIDNETAEVDACQIEHHVAAKTMKQLRKFVEFIQKAPCEPIWVKHFEYFDKTGIRKKCNLK